MIPNIAVGPPVKGLPETVAQNSQSKTSKGENRSGTFEKALDEKINSPAGPKTSAPPARDKSDEVAKKKDAEDDRKPVAETAKAPAPAAPKKPQTAREKAIQKFMDSFESEFGIPSTRIVEAMAHLEPEEVAKSPEETAGAVIAELDLDDESKTKAAVMYAGLLAELQKTDPSRPALPPVPTESMMEHPRLQGMQERLSLESTRRQALNKSLDQLNSKFWMKDASMAKSPIEANSLQNAAPMEMMERANVLEDGFDDELANASGLDLDAADTLEQPRLEDGQPILRQEPRREGDGRRDQVIAMAPPAMQQQGKKEVASSALKGKALSTKEIESLLAQEAKTAPSADALRKAALARETSLPADQLSLKNVDALKGFDAAPKMELPSANAFAVQSGFSSGKNSADDAGDESAGRQDGEASSKNAQGLNGPGQAHAKADFRMDKLAPAAPLAPGQQTPAEKDANVRQLMNQAQYLIKKGGGEMKVRMTPEGLGQVQLKVLVQDGKVNVQMAAESNEAKKAIESGLSELKSSLAAHKLGVDHIKVDVVSSVNTDTGTRNQSDLGSNPQNEGQARQFWNNFQENFGNRQARDGMYDIPGFKNYRQSRQPDVAAPLEAASRTAKPERADGRGSSIDMVA